MLSIARVGAGSVWRYYLPVTAGVRRPRRARPPPSGQLRLPLPGVGDGGSGLAGGVPPPGVWTGRACPALGVAGVATERELELLFGQGLYPRADAITAECLAADHSPAAVRQAVKLGYAVRERTGKGGSVTAWDMVLRPPPSFHLLWALADDATRRILEDCHLLAGDDTLASLEERGLIVRSGRGSTVRRRARPGVAAVRFRHWTNRHGMPLLHDHYLISTRVQRPEGDWSNLHGRALLEQAVAAGTFYTQRVLEEACERLGLALVERETTRGLRTVPEIAGIPEDLIAWTGTRNEQIMCRLEDLAAEYTALYGYESGPRAPGQADGPGRQRDPPTQAAGGAAAGAAGPPPSAFGAERIDQLLALARRAAAAIRAAARPVVDLAGAAADVAAVVYVHRGRFRRRHLLAEARRHLTHELRGQRAEPGLDERIVAAALAHCCALTKPAGPLAGEHTAYTLTLADQMPRRTAVRCPYHRLPP
ncbi:MobF family relaxase [Streptomyces sp. CNQ-509]|uniref:MobF family relaxase n=1 Tax=Streptomyces sp. CNQ-509 TaxID=444103 RepID=UPI00099D4F01|nr:MobF family relaxase [Streptomyces sp. CNQ-509]